ncbi:MAG: hypothetical protein UU11_C0002G0132 [Parcubacteria group bacterium GW2011_GWF2_40_69]|nr:MAG: hypothetical protein UT25_C0002G0159 [Parcubacteria group bacterium GW2011_GWC1_39_12]KKR19341.1 MAG: hypothetical protein UT49_C0002G0187 [Parcubacteria group bacterium GW2011_GWF1_39_37]KKR35276.1 MAG: hypothetical protein UT68_C0004G0084 [Parcubacteria group bacterium GW2011_GWC2_40_10]KKR52291.1 MAG: hypothetical protein UT89_C0002G0092 [Parcubacteria group bacterium GW2011_GWE1_40_20]KKR66261.1 MAG: hypothetical protein UU06_C0003G0011 [Parcubacteria group bacterium GW2011_GWB1_40_
MVTIEEYRKILNDQKTSDEDIIKRIKYLEVFCRNVIRSEIKSHVSKKQKESKSR